MMKKAMMMMAVSALPGLASAQNIEAQLFPTDGTCYLRQYSKGHLADHPDQLVTQIAVGPHAPEWAGGRYLPLVVALYMRGSDERYYGVAYCEAAGKRLACGMEGDAGSFSIEPGKDGAIRLTVGRGGMFFEGSDGFVEISGTSGDDRVFSIPRVPADACP